MRPPQDGTEPPGSTACLPSGLSAVPSHSSWGSWTREDKSLTWSQPCSKGSMCERGKAPSGKDTVTSEREREEAFHMVQRELVNSKGLLGDTRALREKPRPHPACPGPSTSRQRSLRLSRDQGAALAPLDTDLPLLGLQDPGLGVLRLQLQGRVPLLHQAVALLHVPGRGGRGGRLGSCWRKRDRLPPCRPAPADLRSPRGREEDPSRPHLWLRSISSLIFSFCSSRRLLFSKTSCFSLSFSCRAGERRRAV